MRVEVDADICVGSGQCVMAAPEAFDQDDDGIVVVLEEAPRDVASARQAIRLCPARALREVP